MPVRSFQGFRTRPFQVPDAVPRSGRVHQPKPQPAHRAEPLARGARADQILVYKDKTELYTMADKMMAELKDQESLLVTDKAWDWT